MGLGLTEDFDDLKVHINLNKCGIPYPNDVPDHFELMYLETPRPWVFWDRPVPAKSR